MRSLISLALVLAGCPLGPAHAADLPYFSVLSDDAGAWPDILSSIGLQRQPAGLARIFVARSGRRGVRRNGTAAWSRAPS